MGTTMEQKRLSQQTILPRVTFIIAHHNYEQYLGKCIESALAQTYPNIKICVIDDCSNNIDSVGKIVRDIEFPLTEEWGSPMILSGEKITTIYLTDKNHGQAYARNRGIERMWNDTDVFAILDADDENYPTKIEECIKPFLRNPNEVGAVYADTAIYNVDTQTLTHEYREPFDQYRLIQECIVHSGCLISKFAMENVLENGLVFDEDMPPCEDYDLWIRIAERFMIEHIPEILTFIRVHSQNSTNTTTHEHRMSKLRRIHEKRQIRYNGL
jgi:glycosyltransferase involved in cell wall biosynthesis